MDESEKNAVIQDINAGSFLSENIKMVLEKCSSALLYSWNDAKDFIEAGKDITLSSEQIDFKPSFAGRSWPLGCKPDKTVYDEKNGEPFLLVGCSARDAEGEPWYYPFDLYYGDNDVYSIIYVKPANGELESRIVAASELRSGGETQTSETGTDGFVQQTLFEVTTAEDGTWSIVLSAEQSLCSNGLQYYYWETEDFEPESGRTTSPYLEASGVLKDGGRKKQDYKLALTVCDLLGDTDTVEVTIRVRRPENMCRGCTSDTCICTPEECDCRGCGKSISGPPKPQSCDPNEMAGMYGFGDAATQRFVVPGEEMTYTIYFENKADATAAAQEVRVTGQLSRWLDWSTFQLAEVGFRNQIDAGLSRKSNGISEVALEGTAWKVRTEVALNQKRGEYNCYLRIVDETTADGWPESPYDGFLPPNDDDHSGEGYIRYKVRVRDDAPMGARIDAEATIVFDYNDPITTAPAWFNWVGARDTVAATGYMTWDETEGATYEVSIWTGEADPTGAEAQSVISSGTLTENRWRLPFTLQDGVTYFWRVTTTDAQGETTDGPIWSFDLNGRVSRKLTSGWNLVSLPFVPEAYSERVLLSRTLFTAEEEAFVRPLSLELGRAYWLWQGETDEPFLDLFPTTEIRGNEGLSLHGGWNMIGPTEEDTAADAQAWQYQPEGWRPAKPQPNAGEGYMIYLEQ